MALPRFEDLCSQQARNQGASRLNVRALCLARDARPFTLSVFSHEKFIKWNLMLAVCVAGTSSERGASGELEGETAAATRGSLRDSAMAQPTLLPQSYE